MHAVIIGGVFFALPTEGAAAQALGYITSLEQ
jgi:hypothetical protein